MPDAPPAPTSLPARAAGELGVPTPPPRVPEVPRVPTADVEIVRPTIESVPRLVDPPPAIAVRIDPTTITPPKLDELPAAARRGLEVPRLGELPSPSVPRVTTLEDVVQVANDVPVEDVARNVVPSLDIVDPVVRTAPEFAELSRQADELTFNAGSSTAVPNSAADITARFTYDGPIKIVAEAPAAQIPDEVIGEIFGRGKPVSMETLLPDASNLIQARLGEAAEFVRNYAVDLAKTAYVKATPIQQAAIIKSLDADGLRAFGVDVRFSDRLLGSTVPTLRQTELAVSVPSSQVVRTLSTDLPVGTRINAEQLFEVKRSNEQLTELAKFIGLVPATRKAPLPTSRIEALRRQHPEAANFLRTFGTPVNTAKLRSPDLRVELPSGGTAKVVRDVDTPVVDVPVPANPKDIYQELLQTTEQLRKTDSPAEVAQLEHHLDRLRDALTDVPDLSNPQALAEVHKTLPSDLITTSTEGVQRTQAKLVADALYEEKAKALQEIASQVDEQKVVVSEALDNLVENTPDIGRQTLLENPDFAAVPVDPARVLMAEVGDAVTTNKLTKLVNESTLYHGTKVQDLDLHTIDPVAGGSRNEFGTGIYLTNNRELAEDYAKASIHRNLPALAGREFDEVGTVHQVVPDIKAPIDATVPPSSRIRDAFIDATKNSEFFDPYIKRAYQSWAAKTDKPLSQFWSKMDELTRDFFGKDLPFPEE
jgi:hypothetical protein